MKYKYIYIFTALIGFCLSACVDDARTVPEDPTETTDDGMVDVTLSFTLDGLENAATRADGEDDQKFDLTNIDLLVYALRDENDQILYQYGKGIVDEDLKNAKAIANNNYTATTDNNQTLMKVTWKENTHGRYEMQEKVTLRVMRGTVFKLSCWAQSRETDAYDFNYLTAVKVRYDNELENNNEKLDAFCATSIFSIGQVDSKITVNLTRPFAQINGGILESDRNNSDYEKYTYSSIKLGGVARYFNVVENKAWSDKEINRLLDDNDSYGKNYNPAVKERFENEKVENKEKRIATQEVEFKMAQRLSEDKGTFTVHDYSDWDGTTGKPTEKTYKSLSMCYVLVPEVTYSMDNDGNYEIDGGTATDPDGYRWVNDKDGNSIQLDKEGNVLQAYDKDGNIINGYLYKEENIIDEGVVSPDISTEPEITLSLLSLSSSKNGTSTDVITYPPKDDRDNPIKIKVKRNWRTNLLFDNWNWVTSQ